MTDIIPISNSFELPPTPYLYEICEDCPKSAKLYIDLWRKRGKKNRIIVDKNHIRQEFHQDTKSFNNNLMHLVRKGKVNVYDHPHCLAIEMVDWEYDENPLTP